MKSALTCILITFCFILLPLPHGGGLPLMFLAIAGLFFYFSELSSDSVILLLGIVLGLTCYFFILYARFKNKGMKTLVFALIGVIGLDLISGAVIFMGIEQESKELSIISAIPFWLTSLVGLFMAITQMASMKSELNK